MSDLPLIFPAALAAVLIIDLYLSAVQATMSSATLRRLIEQWENHAPHTPQTIRALSLTARPKAAIHLTHVIARFLLLGLAISWIYAVRPSFLRTGWFYLGLIIAGLTLAWAEWQVEARVARRKEIKPSSNNVTEDEIKILVDASQQTGVLEQDERKMIYSIFRLGDTLVREIMIPRIDITALDVQTPIQQAVDSLLQSGYSRLPVYEETIDNIIGLLYTKDLLRVWRENLADISLRALLRPAYFVPEAKKVDELLAEMQSQRIHMAIIVDEYGGIAGLVTLEDIVEEIVGEIQDEFDQAEESPYVQIGEGEYIFQGKVDLDDFNEVMEANLPVEEADTLGGFIYNRLGRVPVPQEMIQVDDIILIVEQVLGRRIRKVRARRLPKPTNESATSEKEDRDGIG